MGRQAAWVGPASPPAGMALREAPPVACRRARPSSSPERVEERGDGDWRGGKAGNGGSGILECLLEVMLFFACPAAREAAAAAAVPYLVCYLV